MFKLSVRLKLFLGLAFILLIFGIQSTFVLRSIGIISQSFEDVTRYGRSSKRVAEIKANITEIQREALVFSQSGKDSVIEKMKSLNVQVKNDLHSLLEETNNHVEVALINSMLKVVSSYGDGIVALKKRYTHREELLENILPSVSTEGANYYKNK